MPSMSLKQYIADQNSDLQHYLFLATMDNKLHLAPLENPKRVLDIATGTGKWAIDFGSHPVLSILHCS